MKTIKRLALLVAVLLAIAPGAWAQSNPGCFTKTISATGRTLLYTNSGNATTQFSGSYYTTGSPASVTIAIETANVSDSVATPFNKLAALTDTTAAQFGEASGGTLYWYANTTALSGGTSPTILLTYCMRLVTSTTDTTLVTSTAVTGSGLMVLQTTPTLITPAIGAATATSVDATSFLDTGVAGSTVGEVRFHNATSGTITLSPATGALGTITASLPASATAWTLGTISVPWRDELTGSAVDRVFFTATRGWIIDSCSQVHSVAAGGVSTMQLVKDTGTSAPGAGTDLLTAAFNLNATANTVQAKASGDFVSLAARTLAIGDRIAVDYADAIQSTAGNSVTCTLIPN